MGLEGCGFDGRTEAVAEQSCKSIRVGVINPQNTGRRSEPAALFKICFASAG